MALKYFLVLLFYVILKDFQIIITLTEWWAIVWVAIICGDLKILLKKFIIFIHACIYRKNHWCYCLDMSPRCYPFIKSLLFKEFSNLNEIDGIVSIIKIAVIHKSIASQYNYHQKSFTSFSHTIRKCINKNWLWIS